MGASFALQPRAFHGLCWVGSGRGWPGSCGLLLPAAERLETVEGTAVVIPAPLSGRPGAPCSECSLFRPPLSPPPLPLQCSIDLKKNVLVIGTTGSQTTFLPEGELPECARLAYGAGREDLRPEEIADQELAEALQKSVEDAGTAGAGAGSAEGEPARGGWGGERLSQLPECNSMLGP